MRPSANCFSRNWIRVFSLLIPVGPPLGLGLRDGRAWEHVAERL